MYSWTVKGWSAMDSPYLTYGGASEYTTLSQPTLRRYVMMNAIPYSKVGKRVLFNKTELDIWMNKWKHPAISSPVKRLS